MSWYPRYGFRIWNSQEEALYRQQMELQKLWYIFCVMLGKPRSSAREAVNHLVTSPVAIIHLIHFHKLLDSVFKMDSENFVLYPLETISHLAVSTTFKNTKCILVNISHILTISQLVRFFKFPILIKLLWVSG